MEAHLQKRFAVVLSLASVVVLIISGYLVFGKYQNAFRASSDMVLNYQTIRAANQVLISINEAALDVSTFLYSKKPETIKKLPEIMIAAQVSLSALTQLTRGDPNETPLIEKLNQLVDKKIKFLREIMHEYSFGKQELALKIASDQARLQLTSDITQLIIEIKKIEWSQVDAATSYYEINEINAAKFFILLGTLNVCLALLNFMVIRRFLD